MCDVDDQCFVSSLFFVITEEARVTFLTPLPPFFFRRQTAENHQQVRNRRLGKCDGLLTQHHGTRQGTTEGLRPPGNVNVNRGVSGRWRSQTAAESGSFTDRSGLVNNTKPDITDGRWQMVNAHGAPYNSFVRPTLLTSSLGYSALRMSRIMYVQTSTMLRRLTLPPPRATRNCIPLARDTQGRSHNSSAATLPDAQFALSGSLRCGDETVALLRR